MPARPTLRRYAALSITAAIVTIGLKAGAYFLTGSVGLLSDALESVVNLVAGIAALMALIVAYRPPDDNHEFGHEKVEYFAGGFEGALILIAAAGIGAAAMDRLANPHGVEQAGVGIAIAAVASVLNYGVSRILYTAGTRYNSVTLVADAHHLMTDVWTSVGVIVGVAAVAITGWSWLDPVIALAVAANIVWTGTQLVKQSFLGLTDAVLPANERAEIEQVLNRYRELGADWHALRTRGAGVRRFVTVHILVPGDWTVQRGHDFIEAIEHDLHRVLDRLTVLTHLEPLEDPVSWDDVELDRQRPTAEV